MPAMIVVAVAEHRDHFPRFVEAARSVGPEDVEQCLVAAFVLSLGLGMSRPAGDSSAPIVSEEELSGHDPALTVAVEGVAVIGQHLLGYPVVGECLGDGLDRMIAVFHAVEGLCADVEAGGVIEELIHRDLGGGAGELEFESVELPQFHGVGADESDQ